MSFELGFVDAALKEWRKLDNDTREQFKKKLEERCQNPRVPSAKLTGSKDRYKIKLRGVGYRLVYEVRDAEILVIAIAIGKRTEGGSTKALIGAKFQNSGERIRECCFGAAACSRARRSLI